MNKMHSTYIAAILALFVVALVVGAFTVNSHGQETAATSSPGLETLAPVEVEPPADDQRRVESRTGQLTDGFGYDQPIPSGMPFSDYSLTPSEIVSSTRTTSNLATVHAATSVVENKGIYAQGNQGLADMLKGLPGVWVSSYGGNPFRSQIVMRGFSNESPNRVSLLVDGRPLNMPRQEANTNFFFPEMVERIEVLRGDGTVQFGNKAIGGAINVILKKPRQNPGTYFGVEAGSWHTDREWAACNFVKGPVAAGVFLGRYYQEGWRIYEGNGVDAETLARPGPWTMQAFNASLDWKITPRLTFDITYTKNDQRSPFSDWISNARWETRDLRNFHRSSAYDNGPDEIWDTVSIAKLLYDGDWLGNLEFFGSWRSYSRRTNSYAQFQPSDNLWQDWGLSLKYDRSDSLAFVRNDLTAGTDYLDGRFRREARYPILSTNFPPYNAISFLHAGHQNGYRDSLSYYLINTTRFWDRLILGLGYRIETYDLNNLWANDQNRNITNAQESLERQKSASQWSLGFIYDLELGSNVYYKHSRLYRFPNFDDMINYGAGPPFWPLEPDEGTLEEVSIRHWITRNIYAECAYYEMDMDTEILYGTDLDGNARNLNVQDVSHSGIELSAMILITPRWTLKGNVTHQKVIVRTNFHPEFVPYGFTTEDKWLWQNPSDMANASLAYSNQEWGFSGIIKYHYVGSQYRTNDPFNRAPPLEPAKWGDLAFSQQLFGGMATLYFGINNFTDRTYALWGTKTSPYISTWPVTAPVLPDEPLWYPDAGRTYYAGVKSSMDFDRMRLPTADDLVRMNRSLYGFVDRGRSAFTGMGSWMRNLVPF